MTYDDAYELPYALHVALSSAIREADRELPDGWSDRDRSEVAARLLRQLRERLGSSAGRAAILQALELGLKLSGTYGVFDDWMVRATQRLVEAGQWTGLAAGLNANAANFPEFRAIHAAIQGVQLRRIGRAADAIRVLDGTDADVESGSLAAQLVRLHLAHALRNKGDYTRAAEIYRDLLGGEFDAAAHYWLCDYDYLNGRFATALAVLQDRRSSDAADEGERLRLIGHIWRVNARFGEATDAYTEAIALARSEGLVAAEAKALANLAQTACWSGDTATMSEVANQARQLLDLVPNPVELVKILSAEAIASAMVGHPVVAWEAVGETRRLADEIGYRGGHNLADVAEILLCALAGDHDRASRTRSELDERTRTSGGNTYWVPIVTTWIDGVDMAVEHCPAISWIDNVTASLGRWAEVAIFR
ncbi:MAG: hypothetical protein ACRDRX_10205 [Pseudonocardiaceae bacterium]